MKFKTLLFGSCLAIFAMGCHTDMWYQAKVTAYDKDDSGIFQDGAANRPIVKGAVAQGWSKTDEAKYTGFLGKDYVDAIPKSLNLDGENIDSATQMKKVLKRGEERYGIACAHCHGAAGDGNGMITQRGWVQKRVPGNYHTKRLREMPAGYFYDVISNGYGVMYSQASRVAPDDRWAIVAYIRALQLSQNAPESALNEADKKAMAAPAEKKDPAHGGGH